MQDSTTSSIISTLSATPMLPPINIHVPQGGTDWFPALITGFTALGVVFINEYFKRKDKENLHSEGIFKKKLDLYEKLFNTMCHAYDVAFVIFENKSLTKDDRYKIWSKEVLSVADFIDKHSIYLNETVTRHCAISLVDIESIPDLDGKEKERRLKQFFEDRGETIQLIREESGLKRLDKVLKSINKPKLTSGYNDYFEKIKRERKVETLRSNSG